MADDPPFVSVIDKINRALHVLEQWRGREAESRKHVVEQTEEAAVAVQSVLDSMLDCYSRPTIVLDASGSEVHDAMEALQRALYNEEQESRNNELLQLLQTSFPAVELAVALQAMKQLESERLKLLQVLVQHHGVLSALHTKFKNAMDWYAKLQSVPRVRRNDLANQRMLVQVLRSRRKSTSQTEAYQQEIFPAEEEMKKLDEQWSTRQSILVAVSEAGCSDALNELAEVEGITWSPDLTINNYQDCHVLSNSRRHKLYKATECSTGKQVILKEFDVSMLSKLHNELKLLQSVPHPRVISVLGCFSNRFKAYIVFPFFTEGSLDEWIRTLRSSTAGPIPARQWRTIWQLVLQALQVLHVRNDPIAHGNLKPSSIFVAKDGVPRMVIGDFDFSQATSSLSASQTLTQASDLESSATDFISQTPSVQRATLQADMLAFAATVMQVMTTDELVLASSLFDLIQTCRNEDPAKRPTVAVALEHPCFAIDAEREIEQLEHRERHLASSQTELDNRLQQLNEERQHATATVEELQQEQEYVLRSQAQLKARQIKSR
eukprot:GILK01017837.1.p1 GENE.GILK01017837.1~~GILK01017837.1.p1  ORF type:complete len:585 (-),score=85.04 GILK01017837.1:544-2193(-)